MMTKEKRFKDLVRKVTKKLGVPKEDIFTNTKRRNVVDARRIIYYLCSNLPMRIVYIQDYMKRSGYEPPYSCIPYGINQIQKKIDTDQNFAELIERLK